MSFNKILVTGGAGFIGGATVRMLIQDTKYEVVNIDKLTYAGNLDSLSSIKESPKYHFEQIDICNEKDLTRVFHEQQPSLVMHLAAESHVDRSIEGPANFINTNIIGTFNLLEVSRNYFNILRD